MKTKNKSLNRALSFLLVLVMIFGSIGITGWGIETAYADDGAVSVDVYLSLQYGGYIVPKQEAAVSSDLAETYGYTDSVSSGSAVSVLDVLVKVHEIAKGIKTVPDQNDIDTINGMLALDSSGYIKRVMGENTSNFGFAVNGKVPNDGTLGSYGYNGYTINQATVNSRDGVEFFIYQDSYALDHYAWFEQNGKKVTNLTVMPNSDVRLAVKGYPIGWYGLAVNSSIYYVTEDTQIVTIVPDTGVAADWSGKRTDADDGTVSLSFSTPGAYVISAMTDEYEPIIMPWLDVTVIDPKDNMPSSIPENDISTYVTITDADNTYVTKQALDVGWFDIRPFMASGTESYVLSDDILTANALIEAVYFHLFGKDPSRGDLDVAANSTTAQAIKANLDIDNGSWGLSTGSVFGNDKLLMSTINDSFGASGIGGDAVGDGDDIVFYSYDKEYAYFEVMKIETSSVDYGTVYPVFDVKLKILEKTYPSTVSPVSGAGIYVAGESWCYATTGAIGVVDAEFMRGTSSSGELLITAKGDSIIQLYLRIKYSWDGSNVTIICVSQDLTTDTSLSTFTVNAYGTALDAADYSGNNLAFNVDSDIENVTLTAIVSDSDASLSSVTVSGTAIKTINFPALTGGSVTIPLDPGLNTISFKVINGTDEETYSININRSTSTSDAVTAANRVINGITAYEGYSGSAYDYNWIIGKIGVGKTISTAETEAFLTQVVGGADSLNVGSAAKTAIALTALNIDATKVPSKDSAEVIDLVAQVYDFSGNTIYISYLPYMLMLEDLGNYTIPDDAKWGREELIQYALDNYSGSSGWNAGNGIDNAAMMIPALAPYYKNAENADGCNGISEASCAAIKVKVDEVVEQFKTLQKSTGSFDNNSDSTAVVIAALSSLGIDPDGTDFTKAASGKSALEALFAYETSDHRLGYTSTTYSEYSSKDGLLALASYLEYYADGSKNGDGCAYRFTKAIAPYTSWPDADLLTGIKVTAPTNTVYSYNASETSFAVDTDGMIVTGIYNGEASNTTNVAISSCTISTINRASEGTTQEVTVSYQGCAATFMVTVLKSNGEPAPIKTVSVKVKSNSKVIVPSNSVVIEEGKTTAIDVLKTVLDGAGIDYVIKGGYYVSEIDGLGEFDKGKNSGWLYSVNGVTPQTTAASEYKLEAGDAVVWYYTLDYTKDSSTSSWKQSVATEEGASAGIAKIEVTAKVDASGKATAVISSNEISTAIADAVESAQKAGENAKAEIQITVKGADNASSVENMLPKDSVKELSQKAVAVTIKTSVAEISLDKDTIKTLSAEASGDVKITVSKLGASDIANLNEEIQAEIGDKPVFDFSIMSGSKTISEFGGKVTVTVPYIATDQELANGLVVYYVNEQGSLEIIKNCVYDEKSKTMTFTTQHFSKYAIGYKSIDFTDVKGHWAKDYITYLAARDVISGMTQATFAPNSNITRAQFVQILANLSGEDSCSYGDNKASSFNDVSENAWYAKAAAWAADKGIATGIKNKDGSANFSPDANISRQDMAVMILRYTEKVGGYSLAASGSAAVFSDDNQIADYAKEAVTQLQQAGVLNGKTSATFAPKNNATRAESAKMISMLIENDL